ncbi:hypothetical protein [Comamonas terrigena]|uniref:Uncharacterized protein n=1 Tax=Comamonas terrigena TaxID=32013 RepID=A0A2A7UYF5_COMTR|nr:hypothetical protein [Comamonas terrigena]PEH90274.1 hypothetical protein CRM82_18275 [Comamonas terrigena]BBL25611.1 hypothetical protein CT3_30660 [Comamonas terrigena NBRC 13299]SUY70821.1 Uncharacterised protein [Comamonas terrigena]
MTINLDVLITTPEDYVDMKAGLDTLQGLSDGVRCISESILTGEVPKRMSHKDKIRTSLKRNFKGSYGQIFSIDVYDDELLKKYKKIGAAPFIELISYFLKESVYLDGGDLSSKADKVLENLGYKSEEIIEQLRTTALENIHQISMKFDHNVVLRHRKSRESQIPIAYFDEETAKSIKPIYGKNVIDLTVGITRFNIHTGNGRLQLLDHDETVSFGFAGKYKEMEFHEKKIFSENLNKNNGILPQYWEYMKVSALPVELPGGKIIKYILRKYNE